MSSLLPWTRLLLCTFLLTCMGLNSASAAPTPGDQDLIRDRQNRLLEEQQRRLQELQDLPGKADKPQ
ncbi:ShlB family hemolysin secretion/activation protein, partial [Pseudomonas cedrina]